MFRLFDVPHVVFRNIINQLTPTDMIAFTLCARRARKLVKLHRFKSIKWELGVYTSEEMSFVAVNLNGMGPLHMLMTVLSPSSRFKSSEKFEFLELDGCIMPYQAVPPESPAFIGDTHVGMKKSVTYILELLNQNHITSVPFDPESVWLFEWLNEMNVTYANGVTLDEKEFDEKQYAHVLRHCIPSEVLYITTVAPENFRYEGPFQKLSLLTIKSGSWVTVDNLMAMDAIAIQIATSSLTSSDFNRFLKNWLIGGSRLKHLIVNMTTIEDYEKVLAGLEDKLEFVEKKRDYMWEDSNIYPQNVYDLTRDDGVVASFKIKLTDNGGSQFRMFIWPDFDGRSHLGALVD